MLMRMEAVNLIHLHQVVLKNAVALVPNEARQKWVTAGNDFKLMCWKAFDSLLPQ